MPTPVAIVISKFDTVISSGVLCFAMSNSRKSLREKELEQFARRFPRAFFMKKCDVVPLVDNVANLIIDALNAQSMAGKVGGFVAWYTASPAYQKSVAMGMRKRDLLGNRVDYVSQGERNAAKQWLIDRGQRSPALAKMFNQGVLLQQ